MGGGLDEIPDALVDGGCQTRGLQHGVTRRAKGHDPDLFVHLLPNRAHAALAYSTHSVANRGTAHRATARA